MKPRSTAAALAAAAALLCGSALLSGSAARAQTTSLQERRQWMRQVSQQLQSRLEQRLRCIDNAKSFSELDQCQRSTATGWHHGPGMGGTGMGGWTCPIW